MNEYFFITDVGEVERRRINGLTFKSVIDKYSNDSGNFDFYYKDDDGEITLEVKREEKSYKIFSKLIFTDYVLEYKGPLDVKQYHVCLSVIAVHRNDKKKPKHEVYTFHEEPTMFKTVIVSDISKLGIKCELKDAISVVLNTKEYIVTEAYKLSAEVQIRKLQELLNALNE